MPSRDRSSKPEPSTGQHQALHEHGESEQPQTGRHSAPAQPRRQHPLDPEGWPTSPTGLALPPTSRQGSRQPQEPLSLHSAEEHSRSAIDAPDGGSQERAETSLEGQTPPQGRPDDQDRPGAGQLRELARDWARSDAAAAYQDLLRRLRRLGMLGLLGFILLLAAILGIALQAEGPPEPGPKVSLAPDPGSVEPNSTTAAAIPAPPAVAPAMGLLERRIAELEVELMHLRARLEALETEVHAPEAPARTLQPARADAAVSTDSAALTALSPPGRPQPSLADPFGNPFLAAVISRATTATGDTALTGSDSFTLTKPQYALQLAAFRARSAALAFAEETGLERWSLFLDPQPPWTFVLNGFFEDAETARIARTELPPPVQQNRPIIRKLEANTRLQRLPGN